MKNNCKLEEHSITYRNYTATYCQTLEEVHRLLRLEKPKSRQKFSKNLKKKLEKICHMKNLKAIQWQIKNFQ